jgi:hypothetical protein
VISIIVLLAAIVLIVGLFDQTLSSAVAYQRNTSTANECGNLLDSMLLAPAVPISGSPAWFGLQCSYLPTYNLDPFALMRLDSSTGTPISYQKTGQTYSVITTSPNNYLLYPYSDAISYSTASTALGLNGVYGFQLSLTPTANVSVTQISINPEPLSLSLNVRGVGFPLANATVNYLLIPIQLGNPYPEFETINNQMGTIQTSPAGSYVKTFSNFFPNPNLGYAFVAYAYLDGITGIGYCVSPPVGNQRIVPFLDPLSTLDVTLANSNDIPVTSSQSDSLFYNSTFVLESANYEFEQISIPGSNSFGSVTSGPGYPPVTISMGSYTPGVLVVAYENAGNNGVVMMPWGFSSLDFSLAFGQLPISGAWIATDLRQVEVNGVSYQAKLSLWSTQSTGSFQGTV